MEANEGEDLSNWQTVGLETQTSIRDVWLGRNTGALPAGEVLCVESMMIYLIDGIGVSTIVLPDLKLSGAASREESTFILLW